MRQFINIVENASPIRQAFEEISSLQYGGECQFSCEIVGRNTIRIDRIETREESRGEGHASAIMKQITSIADQYGVILDLEVAPSQGGGMDGEQLAEWYRRYGFEHDAYDPAYEGVAAYMMSRQPLKHKRNGYAPVH